MPGGHFDSEQFVRAAGDAIIAAGADGSIVLWNPAAERMFGYTESEALGRSLDLIIPERFRQRHWDGYRQVMHTGHTKYGVDVLRVPAIHKDGPHALHRLHRRAPVRARRRRAPHRRDRPR